mgnify:CR=1 FL=1
MIELIEANWLLILLAVLVGFVVAWFLLSGSRKTRITREESSDEPVGAKRNQALIDAPPASAKDPAPPPTREPAPEPVAKAAPTPQAEAPAAPPPAPPEDKPAAPANSLGGAGAAVGTAAAEESVAAPGDTIDGDDLTKLKGVGPKLATQLRELGVTSFAQIAAWSEADIDRIDDQLGRFKGRIRRDNWIEQARLLSSGDTAAYEAQFGKL